MVPVPELQRLPGNSGIELAIDRGGTFTDVWAKVPGHPDIVMKLLSVNPEAYEDAPAEGIRRVLETVSGREIPRSELLPKSLIKSIRMGTTVATNALLERKGTRHAFLVTEGFRDVLDIGHQSRPELFALGIRKPELLYDRVSEIAERVVFEEFKSDPRFGQEDASGRLVKGVTGDLVRVLKPLDEDDLRSKLELIRAEGIDTLAICFAHSYIFPDHELRAAEIATEMGFRHVSISSTVGRGMIKMVPRGSSATADAYLTPKIQEYVRGFATRFEGHSLDGINCDFMQSGGGLASYESFSGLGGILSGPAGGVVGYAKTTYDGVTPLVGFDMGGTSTDVSRYGGSYEHVFETMIAGVSIQSPQLDINTVAAGGGSVLSWSNGLFHVGPESAGAYPGPACYRHGGPLTVTDANLFLGRLLPEAFPTILGPNEDAPLDTEVVAIKFADLTRSINADTGRSMTPYEVASGFLEIANEAMARPIRAITEARGFEARKHHLAVFGGAGGQHACDIATKLGIRRIIIHKYSSILSAYGMSLAEVIQEEREPSSEVLANEILPHLEKRFNILKKKTESALLKQGVSQSTIRYELFLNLRYQGTSTNFMIQQPDHGDWLAAFEETHLRELAFTFPHDHPVLVDDVRVRGISKTATADEIARSFSRELQQTVFVDLMTTQERHTSVVFSNVRTDTRVYRIELIPPGSQVSGPALIIDNTQTIVVVPGAIAKFLSSHIVIDMSTTSSIDAKDEQVNVVDPVRLSVFSHRFMSIAEQMGHTLRKTSISLNIKERLDFSCAIFGPDGDLVANAPHVPVHLGSMSYAVKYQHKLHEGKLQPGDVLVSNHPEAGGTHLPDITVITPVFEEDNKTVCFYTASRGHHVDIGGLEGTSMPPNSTFLWQEGAMIKSFFLVKKGHFDEAGIRQILVEAGKYPGVAPSRRLEENLSDLRAQVAANVKGSQLIRALMDEHGITTVHFYMAKIQENAELAVRAFLTATRARHGPAPLTATDGMDNGARLRVAIDISQNGSATFDFTGTTSEMFANFNAPPAITYSAIIYVLRLLIGADIPLNQGCLAPVQVILPQGCFLNPSATSAVCCGNTHTSQRLADLLLKAFDACAGSQGDMNSFALFDQAGYDADGTPKLGYGYKYGETICGGEGAGPTWHGASGVHVHMTNTRTTDVELLERRLPVIIREFSIRRGSGGKGRYNGGDGVIRDWECRVPLTFSMISERRVLRPYAMRGAEEGANGVNYWVQKHDDGSSKWIQLGPRFLVQMNTGDHCVIHTPGGGGWGEIEPAMDGIDHANGVVQGHGTTQVDRVAHVNGDQATEVTRAKVTANSVRSSEPRATGSFHSFVANQASA